MRDVADMSCICSIDKEGLKRTLKFCTLRGIKAEGRRASPDRPQGPAIWQGWRYELSVDVFFGDKVPPSSVVSPARGPSTRGSAL